METELRVNGLSSRDDRLLYRLRTKAGFPIGRPLRSHRLAGRREQAPCPTPLSAARIDLTARSSDASPSCPPQGCFRLCVCVCARTRGRTNREPRCILGLLLPLLRTVDGYSFVFEALTWSPRRFFSANTRSRLRKIALEESHHQVEPRVNGWRCWDRCKAALPVR